ncbi:hypothetical protein JTB14_007801 [Gonioctena quinquepunctata]|nr:hypothetical protein JTB14_007801 [Gonioctena quinquepunctata]
MESGVSQRSVSGPLPSLLYTYYLPEMDTTTIAAFADEVAMIPMDRELCHLFNEYAILPKSIECSDNKLRINLNKSKSVQVNFTTATIIAQYQSKRESISGSKNNPRQTYTNEEKTTRY